MRLTDPLGWRDAFWFLAGVIVVMVVGVLNLARKG